MKTTLRNTLLKVMFAIAILLSFNSATGQGSENFTNIPTGSPTNYLSRSWTGTDGVTWTATAARTDQTLNGKAIATDGAGKVTSPQYVGGMGLLQFNYVRAFTGTSSRSIEVFVNGSKIGSTIVVSTTSNTTQAYSSNINIGGNVTLELRTSGAQIKIDDISWTSYVPLTAPTVTTASTPTTLTTTSATLGGNVTSDGNVAISGRGIVYSLTATNATPSLLGAGVIDLPVAGTTGAFTADASELTVNTQYSYRAYAINSVGTSYGGATGTTFYTLANNPNAAVVNNATPSSLDVTIDANAQNGNPSNTQYAILVTTTGQYVQATGNLGASPDWQLASAWSTKTVTGLNDNTSYTFQLIARNGANVPANGATVSASTLENMNPELTLVNALPGFGSQCTNSTAVQSFSFNGANLNGSDLTVNALNGFSYSATQNGQYTGTLTIPAGATLTGQVVWVRFAPTAVQSYDGSITISGGGLIAPFSVSATGAGVNTGATVVTGGSSSITSSSAVLAGQIQLLGCTSISGYGVEYSTTNNFINGTAVAGSNLAAGAFSATVTSLQPGVTYYYKAYATDTAGTHYGSQASFITANMAAPLATDETVVQPNSFVANWDAVPGATSYRLDVSTSPTFPGATFTTDLIISEYVEGSSNNKYIEVYNGTGSPVNLADYQMRVYANGASTGPTTSVLTGTLNHGSTIVYKNTAASIYAGTATVITATNYNGNDAVGLWKISTSSYVDIIGSIGHNPGTAWTAAGGYSTLDKTLVRNANVLSGVTSNPTGGIAGNPATGFPTLATEWTVYNIDDVAHLGSHTAALSVSAFVPNYENRTVNGTSELVTGLAENTNYYYRVRAVAANGNTSVSSNTIAVTTAAAPPTFGSVQQTVGVVCEGSAATFNVNGLLANSTNTISYNINGGPTQTITGVVADNSGFATFQLILVLENNGQTLTVTAVDRTDMASTTLVVTNSNTAVLSVNDVITYYADADTDGFGDINSPIDLCEPFPGYVTNNTDCDDTDGTVNATFNFFVDADGDHFGIGTAVPVCAFDATTPPVGYALVGGDCNDAVAAINPGHDEVLYNGFDDNCNGQLDEGFQYTSQVQAQQCGTTLSSINSYIVVYSKAFVTYHRFEVTDVETGAIQILERTQNYFSPTMLASYNYARTYSVRVELQRNGVWLGYYGPSCLVSTPAVLAPGGAATISPSQCGNTIATISTLIATTSLANVTGYRFRVTNVTDTSAPNQVQIIDRGSLHWFALTMLSTYNYGTTYLVEVSIKTNGVFSAFGSPCAVSSPAVPMLNNCGAVIATKGTLISTASLNRVTSYRFEITNFLTGQVTTLDRTQNWFTFNNVPGFTPGGEYGVRIAIMTSGVYSPFGEGCVITAPAAARTVDSSELFGATAYPNPFMESFMINVTTASEDNFAVKVYDMTGRLIESREASLLDMQTLKIGDSYPSGVYNVILTQGENVETLRVIKR